MARRYVRDKIGRFASHGGGGSFGGGGKIGKSAKNVKARAAYKNQAGKLREAKKAASGAAKGGDARRSAYANRQLGGAKSGMTRVSNRLTGRGAAKAKRGAANPNKLASSKKFAAARKAPKGSAVRKDAVSSAKIRRGERRAKAEIRKGAKARASYKPKQEAKQAKERILKKTKAKRMEQGGFKTPKGKMSKTKTSAAKTAYKKRSKNQPTYRVLAQSKGDKSPSAFIYKDAKAARKFAGSFKNDGKATFKALGGGNKQPRGVKKRRGGKVYDNTTNTFIKIKTKKRDLKRKYKYGYS